MIHPMYDFGVENCIAAFNIPWLWAQIAAVAALALFYEVRMLENSCLPDDLEMWLQGEADDDAIATARDVWGLIE